MIAVEKVSEEIVFTFCDVYTDVCRSKVRDPFGQSDVPNGQRQPSVSAKSNIGYRC